MSPKENSKTSDSGLTTASQIAIGVLVGLLLGIGGTFFTLQGRIAKLEGIVQTLQSTEQTPQTNQQPGRTPSRPEVEIRELIVMIEDLQRSEVKESQNEFINFSYDDLERFKDNKVAERAALSLKTDPRFLDVVHAIRKADPSSRSTLLRVADKPLRKTWGELGRVTTEGQTDAGQEAEKLIAKSVLELVRELIGLPEGEFLRLYDG